MKHYDDYSQFCQWILCHAENTKALERALSVSEKMKVTILINGVDVGIDFENAMNEIDQQIDRMVSEKAKLELYNRFSDTIQMLMDLQEQLTGG